jgi:hypothetical protein
MAHGVAQFVQGVGPWSLSSLLSGSRDIAEPRASAAAWGISGMPLGCLSDGSIAIKIRS